MKLRYRLLLLPIVAAAPAIALLIWNQHDLSQARYHEVQQQVLSLAKQEAGEVDRIAEGALQFLVALAQIPDIRDGTPACGDLLPRIRTNYRSYLALIRADINGNVTCSSIGPGPSIKDRVYFQKAVETNSFSVGEYVKGRGTGASSIHFSYPLQSEEGRLTGVIAAALDLDWVADRLREKLPEDTALNVTDANGIVLVHIPNDVTYRGLQIPDEFRLFLSSKQPGVIQVRDQDEVAQVLGYVPIPASSYGFYIGVSRNLDSAFSDIRRTQRRGGVLIALGFFLSLALAALWGEYGIRKPVTALLANAEHWRSGNYSPPQSSWGTSELGQVGRALEELASTALEREKQLRESQKRLRDQQQYLENVLDQVPAGIVQTLPDRSYAFANKAFCDLLGRPRNQVTGHEFTEFTLPEDVERDAKLFDEALAQRQPYCHRKRYVRPDGTVVTTENTVTQLEAGEGFLAVALDMSDRIATETMQQRLINELNHRVKNTLNRPGFSGGHFV